MATPVIAQKASYPVDLAAGDYWWCACGQSKKQPFCDGSHKGTEFTPMKFTLAQAETKRLCRSTEGRIGAQENPTRGR